MNPEQRLIDRDYVERAMDLLRSDRMREVMRMRFGLRGEPPMTFDELAEEFGVSRERVRQWVEKSLREMRCRLERVDADAAENKRLRDKREWCELRDAVRGRRLSMELVAEFERRAEEERRAFAESMASRKAAMASPLLYHPAGPMIVDMVTGEVIQIWSVPQEWKL